MSSAIVYRMLRDADPTGVSGLGHVADLVQLPGGLSLVAWRGAYPSTVIWRGGLGHAMRIHGHAGTRIEPVGYIDANLWPSTLRCLATVAEATDRFTRELLLPDKQLPIPHSTPEGTTRV